MSRKQNLENIQKQYTDFIDKGGMSIIELELNNGDFLIVSITPHTTNKNCLKRPPLAVYFSGDFEKPAYFSGDVRKYKGSYYILINEFTDNYDQFLEQIYTEIVEGYLIPNNLYLTD